MAWTFRIIGIVAIAGGAYALGQLLLLGEGCVTFFINQGTPVLLRFILVWIFGGGGGASVMYESDMIWYFWSVRFYTYLYHVYVQ